MGRIILMSFMLAATVAGCNRFPDLSIQIIDDLAPSEPPECAFTVDQQEVILRGVWDLGYSVGTDYLMVLRIESYIVDTSLLTQAPQGNMNITSYDVTIKLPDESVAELAGGLPNPYRVTTSGVIPPSQTFDEISRGIAAAPMIPSDYRGAIRNLTATSGFRSILLDIRANGTTAGGFSQRSPSFTWPLEICNGCLGVRCEDDGNTRLNDPVGCFAGQDNSGYCAEIVPPA